MNEVIVSLKGGLGNQMFQYAAARAIAARRNASLVLDCAWFEEVQGITGVTARAYALAPFELKVQTRAVGLPVGLSTSLWRRVLRRLRLKLPMRHAGARVFAERAFGFDPQVMGLSPSVWLDGYWQSHRYFVDCVDTIREEFGTPRQLSAASSAMLGEINASEAVCMHVRRGDYVTNADANATHGLCGLAYYEKGLAALAGVTVAPRCFIFSDDPEWVRQNIKLAVPITVVDVNGPDDAHQDLWLMAACRHFVIANSSLSWWAAWLGADNNKTVIAPAQWFKDGQTDTSDLIPVDWIRI